MKDQDGNLLVLKSNELIQKFKISLSKTELRIVNFIIANINSPLYDEEFNTLEFHISDFYKAMGIENPSGSTYEYIKQTIRGLRNKSSDYINFGEYETIVSWIEKPKFYEKSGKVTLKLDDDLKPYLLKMNGYIQSQLNYYFQMNGKYSMRLYELLKSWDGLPSKKFDVDELKLSIDAVSKTYKSFGVFEQKVLQPSVDEINAITDLIVGYEKIKKGRGGKTTHVVFTIRYKDGMNPKKKELVKNSTETPELNIISKEDKVFEKRYGVLASAFPKYTKAQIKLLYEASVPHVEVTGLSLEERQDEIVSYISPKLRKIEATPEETKTTEFKRLLNAVENNF